MEFGIYQLLHAALSLFGIAINVFLLFLAVSKSPKIMRPCSALITNKSLTDIMSSLANFFVMQRIITDGSSVTIIPTGPCTDFGPVACYAGHMFMSSFLEHNLIWLIACYLFRYYILYVRDPSIKSIIFAAFLVYIPSLVHMAVWIDFFASEQKEIALEAGNWTTFNGTDENEMILTGSVVYWSSIVIFVQLVITSFLVVIAYLWIRNVLLNFILSMGADLSKDVKILNKQLVKVNLNSQLCEQNSTTLIHLQILTFQVCIPIWIFLGVLFFLAMYTGTFRPDYLQYGITIAFMLAPVISPFSYILFVPHYWKFCTGKPLRNSSSACITSSNAGSAEKSAS
ncbi:unnamed protein product [Caenorhabditis sp. 36 PRJEB53466]|nr:unnamed protein product [Caenorhabditis sp. 36 PRJEB53466]